MGRLARDLRWRGESLGALLIGLAVERCQRARQSVGGYALIVDAKGEDLVAAAGVHQCAAHRLPSRHVAGGGGREIIDQVALLPIRIDASPPQPASLLSLALRFQLTSYDAAYLELALRLQLPIATRDDALADAA